MPIYCLFPTVGSLHSAREKKCHESTHDKFYCTIQEVRRCVSNLWPKLFYKLLYKLIKFMNQKNREKNFKPRKLKKTV